MNFQPNTTIHLCATDLVMGNGHQILFNSLSEQTNYFLSKKVYTFDEQSYTRMTAGVLHLDVSADSLIGNINYIMFNNANYSNKWFYGNVLKITYINPNTTRIDYCLDSFQSFLFDIDLKPKSYIERRHFSKTNDGMDTILKLPFEDIAVGNEYVMVDNKSMNLLTMNDSVTSENDEIYYMICLVGGLAKEDNPNIFYANTKITSVFTTLAKTLEIETQLSLFVINQTLLNYLIFKGYFNTTTMNGRLVSCIALPVGYEFFKNQQDIRTELFPNATTGSHCYQTAGLGLTYRLKNFGKSTLMPSYLNTSLGYGSVTKYNDLSSAIATYFMRYPFTVLETADLESNRVNVYLDQLFNGKIANNIDNEYKLSVMFALGNTSTVAWALMGNKNLTDEQIARYNALTSADLLSFPNYNYFASKYNIPIISDYSSAFLQANQNQLNSQRQNLSASLNMNINNANAQQESAMFGANMSMLNAQIGGQVTMENAQINGANALANAGLSYQNSMLSVGANAIGGVANLFTGNIGGALQSGLNAGVGIMQANNSMQMQQNSIDAMYKTTSNSVAGQMQQAGNSLLASQSAINTAHGNAIRSATVGYQNAIRSMNARVQDINNMPDTVQDTGAGSFMNIVSGRSLIMFMYKSLPQKILKRLENYFTLYGFKANTFESISDCINKMSTGLFIKTVNANVKGNIPQENLKEIISLFDSGVTLWKGATNYMNYDALRGE